MACLAPRAPQTLLECLYIRLEVCNVVVEFGRVYHWVEEVSMLACIINIARKCK